MTLSAYPAGLARRLAAGVYDLFLLIGLWLAASALLLPFNHGHAVDGQNPWVRLYFLFVPYLFYSWFWQRGGQTLGMKAWRLRLRSATDGGPVTWYQSPLRYAAAWISWLSIVGMLWCVFDPRRRTLQDWASNTELVVVPRGD